MHFKLSKIKRGVKHYYTMKALRKKLGLTGSSRHIRQLKRGLSGFSGSGSVVSPSQPTSASYVHQPRTLSQMTGGV